MNENRGLFVLDGITGMLIATVLLLSILAGLTFLNMGIQQENASNFYDIKDEKTIQMKGSDRASHVVDVK